jgi:DNA-binding transcriptional LysR family regulator
MRPPSVPIAKFATPCGTSHANFGFGALVETVAISGQKSSGDASRCLPRLKARFNRRRTIVHARCKFFRRLQHIFSKRAQRRVIVFHMQRLLSWDDARILLAVTRNGTQASASKALGIDQATVSRHLLRLEDVIGTALFLRDGTRLVPTETGQRLAERAEEAEASLEFMVEPEADSGGAVRIAAPCFITAHLLAPALPLLRQLAAGVVPELVASPETACLTRRDADIALRLTKPNNGGFLARRIATVHYRVYARRGSDPALPWIGFDETLAELPEARWLARRDDEPVFVRAADLQTVLQAVRAGVGRGILPTAVAGRDPSLVALPTPDPPARELWLLVERRVRQVRRVALTLGWVEAVMRDAFPPCGA